MKNFIISIVISISTSIFSEEIDSTVANFVKELGSESKEIKAALEIPGVYSHFKDAILRCEDKKNKRIDRSCALEGFWNNIKSDKDVYRKFLKLLENKQLLLDPSVFNETIEDSQTDKNALNALRNFYKNKLNEALYGGKVEEGSLLKGSRLVSQNIFFNLQEAQLGKNIIASLTSYCIEADKDTWLIPKSSEKRIEIRRSNLKGLSTYCYEKLDTETKEVIDCVKESRGEVGKTRLESEYFWNLCIVNIAYICEQVKIKKLNAKGEFKSISNGSSDFMRESLIRTCKLRKKEKKFIEECSDIVDYSQERACEVTTYVRKAKVALEKTY